MKKRENFYKYLVVFLIGCMIAGNFLEGFSVFIERGGNNTDDFMMRYRESKYLLNGINPFDVITHIREPDPLIGELWDVAGYTPWGMAMGILFNLSFFSENVARSVFAIFYGVVYIVAAGLIFYLCRQKTSCLNSIIMAMLILVMPGWVTGLQWLNIGAILGVVIFGSILLMRKHPYAAGILLGIAATKPQLAAPFFLCLLFTKHYKTFFTALIIPLVSWGIALVLTDTQPFEMIIQFKSITDQIGSITGILSSYFSREYEYNLINSIFMGLRMFFCILLAIGSWFIMNKNDVKNEFAFFSIAAILSGMWTYSQLHDRTVLIIVLYYLFLKYLKLDRTNKSEKYWCVFFIISCVADIAHISQLLTFCGAQENISLRILKIMQYIIWTILVIFIVKCEVVEMKINGENKQIVEEE